jgi:DUF971 family protein
MIAPLTLCEAPQRGVGNSRLQDIASIMAARALASATVRLAKPANAKGLSFRSFRTSPRSVRSIKVESAKAIAKSREVQVNWHDGHASMYNGTWLRVNCPANVHASGQRLLTQGDLLNISPATVEPLKGQDGLKVKWSDGHESVFSSEWLRSHDNSVSTIIDRNQSSWPSPLR